MKRLLITGAGGFLGSQLAVEAAKAYSVTGTYHSKPLPLKGVNMVYADLTLTGSAEKLIEENHPDYIIHTAALADPNACQREPVLSEAVNLESTLNLAKISRKRGIGFLFTSTDMVFDGTAPPYSERTEPSPLCVYARHKVLAEKGIESLGGDWVICRMAWMFGNAPFNPAKSLVTLKQKILAGEPLSLFTDEYRSALGLTSAVEGILLMVKQGRGLYHLGGPERISRYRFGELLAQYLGVKNPAFRPLLQKELPMAAPRPQDLSMDTGKAEALGFRPLTVWEEFRRNLPL